MPSFVDLREFISELEKRRDLVRITAEVDPNLEMTEIADRTLRGGGPALLFENPKGSDIPVLANLFGAVGASVPRRECGASLGGWIITASVPRRECGALGGGCRWSSVERGVGGGGCVGGRGSRGTVMPGEGGGGGLLGAPGT